ncbi:MULTISPECIES: RluA family pseudouridine synthase [Rhodomicrobium]|uniref:RluA family pseudouridine synthase n=1 Tax=Rhodomicrobium TaxID=1068 RepID=UPI000B4A87DE|nr:MULTISPECIES: RluA family pseudouridine synthase [Rhodomicrobium]
MADVKDDIKAVKSADAGIRVDRWLKANFPSLPHGLMQKLLRNGQIRVNGGRVKPDTRLDTGDEVKVRRLADFADAEVRGHEERPSLKAPLGVSKADRNFIESLILFEDDELLVLNKPYGIAVQGGTKTKRHIDGMLAGMEDRFGERPRLVHRLDRDTSGVLLVAKTRGSAARLGKLFQTRSVQKIYWALVKGVPKPPQGKVEAALVKASGPDGDKVRKALPGEQEVAQSAVTHYAVIDRVSTKLAWVSLKPVTGRQHQLRAHMAIIGNPIVGDQKYEGDEGLPVEDLEMKLHLHARRLIVPRGKGAPLDVTAPLPEHMLGSWDLLGLDPERYDGTGDE